MGIEKACPNIDEKVEAIMTSGKVSRALKNAVPEIKLRPMSERLCEDKTTIPPHYFYQRAQVLEFDVEGTLQVIYDKGNNLHHVVVPNDRSYKPLKGIFIETSLATGPLCLTGISGIFKLVQMDGVSGLGFKHTRIVPPREARYSQFVKTQGNKKTWGAGPANIHTWELPYL